MQPGIYPDLDIAAYHRNRSLELDGASKTSLCLLAESPRTFKYAMDRRRADELDVTSESQDEPAKSKRVTGGGSRALRLGSGLHAAMEGMFHDIYAIGPDVARNTKVWKEFEASHPGKICLKPDEAEPILAMKAAVDGYGPAREILSMPGRFEVSYYWIDEETGILCKCRPDWISADQKTIVDFKTARDATHAKFQRAAYDLHYFVSAALTIEGVRRVTGILPARYVFLTIQSSAPHLVAAYEATAEEIELGSEFVRRHLTLLKDCQTSGNWPGLPEEVRPLGLPRWAEKAARAPETASQQEDLIDILEREFSDATAVS